MNGMSRLIAMRLATYNVWNSRMNWVQRAIAIADELIELDADIVALQEVPLETHDKQPFVDFLQQQTGFPYCIRLEYPIPPEADEMPEGLAFLSRFEPTNLKTNWQINRDIENCWAAKITVERQGWSLGITNVHLDWKCAESRRRQIVRITKDLVYGNPCDYDLLCGDFNFGSNSKEESLLDGKATIDRLHSRWRDVVRDTYSERGENAPPTLDFPANPHLMTKEANANKEPIRCDRLYVRCDDILSSLYVEDAGLFGKEPANRFGIVPSDHYGVFADLTFPNQPAVL